jgi:hypothetical protein
MWGEIIIITKVKLTFRILKVDSKALDSFLGWQANVGHFSGVYHKVKQFRHPATIEASSSIPIFQGVDEYGVAVGIEIEMMGDRSATGQNKKKHEFMQVGIEE